MTEKYNHKLIVRSSKDTRHFIQSLGSPTILNWSDIIEDYITRVRKRRANKFAMFKIQLDLLGDLIIAKDNANDYQRIIEDPDEAKKEDPSITTIFNNQLNFWKQEQVVYDHLHNVLKDIGDGILWRVLNYNRSLIHIMSLNTEISAPVLDQGLINELHALGDIVYDEKIKEFVFHAITSAARIGDITTLGFDDSVDFIEIKSKSNTRGKQWKERLDRQTLRRDNLKKIANEGIGVIDEKGFSVKSINGTPKLFMKSLRSLINEAKNVGIATIKPQSYLGLIAIHLNLKPTDNTTLERRTDAMIQTLGPRENDLLIYNSLDPHRFLQSRTPFSIYPLEPPDIADLLMCKTFIKYYFSWMKFYSEIGRLGWELVDSIHNRLEKLSDDDNFFCTISKKNLNVRLPGVLLSRVIFEGLSPSSIVELCENIYRIGPDKTPAHLFPNFSEEFKVWN